MKLYGWLPESYGNWAYVMAETVEDAVAALEKTRNTGAKWSRKYHNEDLDKWAKRPPDVVFEAGEPVFGEIA